MKPARAGSLLAAVAQIPDPRGRQGRPIAAEFNSAFPPYAEKLCQQHLPTAEPRNKGTDGVSGASCSPRPGRPNFSVLRDH